MLKPEHQKSGHAPNREIRCRELCVRQACATLLSGIAALAGLAMSSIATAEAGDLEGPNFFGLYPRHHTRSPVYRGAEVGDAFAVFVHERRIDAYGREIIHRIRICDEGPIYPSPYRTTVPPEYGNRRGRITNRPLRVITRIRARPCRSRVITTRIAQECRNCGNISWVVPRAVPRKLFEIGPAIDRAE